MKKIYILFATIITFTTIITRFVGLDKIPPHLSNDEISIAYDAYSVSKTLRDEHNQFLPISFKSHGTYKTPLTVYLTSISVRFLGNSDFSARLPSSLLGSLTVFILGLLAYELTKNKVLALFASGILAISPWHIYTSRMALETNIALFFLVGGLFLFFYCLHKSKKILLFASFVFFALSVYAYHTQWGLTPLIVGILILLYRKKPFKVKTLLLGFLFFLFLIFPLFLNYLNNRGTTARANTEFLLTNDNLKGQIKKYPNNIFRQGQIVLSAVAGTYSYYIEPGHLFFNSLNLLPQGDPLQAGLILAPFLPMLIIGLFKVKKYFGENSTFVYLWLLFSPVIPALTTGGSQAVRNLPFLAPCVLIIAAGCNEFIVWFRKSGAVVISYILLVLLSLFYFCALYYYFFPKESGENYQYGYEQIAEFIFPRYENYNKIVIDPKFGENYFFDGVPHLYIPYFTSLDPKYLQQRKENDPCGICFAKYEIRGVIWIKEKLQKQVLYIVPYSNRLPEELDNQMKILTEIRLPNNKPAFVIYEKNPNL